MEIVRGFINPLPHRELFAVQLALEGYLSVRKYVIEYHEDRTFRIDFEYVKNPRGVMDVQDRLLTHWKKKDCPSTYMAWDLPLT